MRPELTRNEFLVLLNDHGRKDESLEYNLQILQRLTSRAFPTMVARHEVWENWQSVVNPEPKTDNWEAQLREITEFYSNHIVDGKVNGYHSAFGMITHLYADLQAAGLLNLPVDLTSLSRH